MQVQQVPNMDKLPQPAADNNLTIATTSTYTQLYEARDARALIFMVAAASGTLLATATVSAVGDDGLAVADDVSQNTGLAVLGPAANVNLANQKFAVYYVVPAYSGGTVELISGRIVARLIRLKLTASVANITGAAISVWKVLN